MLWYIILGLTQGTIAIELTGTTQGIDYDFVDVGGLTNIGASSAELDISFLDDFHLSVSASDTFAILDSDQGLTGSFAGLAEGGIVQTSDGIGRFRIGYTNNSVVLSNFVASSGTLLGDCNFDGVVDFSDIPSFYIRAYQRRLLV